MSHNRFDNVPFDAEHQHKHDTLKHFFKQIEGQIRKSTTQGRYQALALTALEESWTWLGKAIRDDQLGKPG